MDYLFLVLGFVILLTSGNYLVKSSVAIARKFNVSTLVIGVTVVSFGTSAPELLVSLNAAIDGLPDISIGNVVGSNIANIALVLAITAVIFPIPVKSDSIKIDWPVMMFASFLFYILALDMTLSRWEGILFIALLLGYVFFLIHRSRRKAVKEDIPEGDLSFRWAIGLLVLSGTGLYFGSRFLVDSAESIAIKLGVDERVISLSVVAFGTSVPELATSAVAAFKKEMDISIGNIIGSNIFNLLAVLGVTATVTPIPVNEGTLQFDIFWMLGIALMLFLLILPLKGGVLTRFKGSLLFIGYIVYMSLLFIQ